MSRRLFYLIIFLLITIVNLSWGDEPLKVRFLDVGYGDAILLQFPEGRSAMIDTGGPETAMKVVENLKGLGISRLDFVVITHSHADHFGGLEKLRQHLKIRHVYVNAGKVEGHEGYFALLSELQKKSIPVTVLRWGEEIDIGSEDTRILVLHPRTLSGSANENSLSLLLTHGKTRFWLTADIQPQGQDEIIRNFPEVLSADCVQVPHHGGRLSELFVSMAKNKIFILSTGKNEYGKPFTEYLNSLSGRLLRTDRDGNIVMASDGLTVKVEHE